MNVIKCICEVGFRNGLFCKNHLNTTNPITRFTSRSTGIGSWNIHVSTALAKNFNSKAEATVTSSINEDSEYVPNTQVKSSEEAAESIRLQKIKHAMQMQLQRNEEKISKRAEKAHEFEIGRRHLANMMGADPNTFTQQDINRAIEYLMPSGLFDPKARPMMKPSQEINPTEDEIFVDETGRPLNVFFYTGSPKLYALFHNISFKMEELNQYEDKMISRGFVKPPPETKIFLDDSKWIGYQALKVIMGDKRMLESEYFYLIETFERLAKHPYSFRIKEFIMKYRNPKAGFDQAQTIKPLTVGEDGIPYATAEGKRKRTQAEVCVKGNGTGEVTINGMDISYFYLKQDREQIMFPLKFAGLLNKVDITAKLTGQGGHTAEAGAIRYAVSLALASFVSPQMVENMRLAGLMQWDVRTRERKKYGQKGARAKFKWVKR